MIGAARREGCTMTIVVTDPAIEKRLIDERPVVDGLSA